MTHVPFDVAAHMVLNSHVYRQQSVAIANGKYLDKSRAKHGKSVPADSPEAQSMLRAIDEELDAIIALPDGPKRYSAVTSDEAIRMLDSLQLAELDGNLQDRIVPPADAPECTVFDYSNYATEDEGTPDLMQHHALALQKLGVVVGRGGVSAYDLHSDEDCKDFFTIKMAAQEYTGGVDGCIAPFGLFRSSATWRSLIVYVHKQSAQQKQAYAEKQSGQQQVCLH